MIYTAQFVRRGRQLLRATASVLLAALFAGTTYTTFANAVAPEVATSINPVRSCTSLSTMHISEQTDNVAYTVAQATADPGGSGVPASCKVTVVSTHPPAGDHVNSWIWLPANGWNGRFQGTGGSGYSGGSTSSLATPLAQGYVAGATDTGHPGSAADYALKPNGGLDWQLVQDNVLGVHEMTVAGKALASAFYGKQVRDAYFTGCSTGGRQGITEASQYPGDYDGIMAGSPAINATKHRIITLYGEMLMNQANDFLPQCKFDAANNAAIQACDKLDGVVDGVLNDPRQCHFDPHTLVGTSTPCGTITQTDADIIAKIWQGPRDSQGNFLWYGPQPGASFSGINDTVTVNGQTTGAPTSLATNWIKYFLLQDPNWDWQTLTMPQFEQLFTQSVQEFGTVVPDNPDLNAFAKDGGKLLMWHGWSDQMVAPEGSIDYYNKVANLAGSIHSTQDFARLFMAPGVGHCGGGNGPQPADPLQALTDWVEHGKAPDTLLAEKQTNNTVTQTRPLCPYPAAAAYKGHGSTDDAKNFQCKEPARH